MKNRGLLNPFTNKTRQLFLTDGYIHCWNCGRSDKGASLHHICGRKSSSVLNAIPLCDGLDCHNSGKIHTPKKEEEYLEKTFRYLIKNGYCLTDKDWKFIKKYYPKNWIVSIAKNKIYLFKWEIK